MTNLAEAIKNARHESGLSQGDLAKRIDVSTSLVSGWETGRYDPTSYLDQLERALGSLVVKTRDFAQWLREEREKKNLTVRKLAELSSLSALTITNIENEITIPQKRTIAKLEVVLGETKQKDKIAMLDEDDEDDEGLFSSEISAFNPHDDDEIKRLMNNVKGIYLLYGRNGQLVYVGKSNNDLAKRVSNHKDTIWYKFPVTQIGYYIVINNKELCDKMEKILIKLLNPLVNKRNLRKGDLL